MELNDLCMGCMNNKVAADVCPYCGWREGSQSDSPLYLPPGTELSGRYILGKVLGHGGFGITYLGWDKELHLKVAIKEYLPEGLGSRSQGEKTVSVYSGQYGEDFEYGLEKFLEEARTLARFQNKPNIVSVFNYFRENGTAYLVMEYVEGVSLKQILQQKPDKRLPLDEVLTYIMLVADALEIVHAAGMVHRDISPDNIYVTADHRVKLLDFGATRKAVGEINKSLSVLLKPGYAPIEQYSSRGGQGPWTDIYALAATFYKLLSGQTPPESIDRLQGAKLISLSEAGFKIPENLEKILNKALAIQPGDRYQSIAEFKAEIERAISVNNHENSPNIKDNSISPVVCGAVDSTVHEQERSKGSQVSEKNHQPFNTPSAQPQNKKSFLMLAAIMVMGFIFIGSMIWFRDSSGNGKSNYNAATDGPASTTSSQTNISNTSQPANIQTAGSATDNNGTKSDNYYIEQLMAQYETRILEAINNNNFSKVENLLIPDSNLYNDQKQLVEELYQQNIKERLVGYEIKDIKKAAETNVYKVYVSERIGIKYPNKSTYETKSFNWIYTVEIYNNKYGLSDIAK